MDYAVAKGKVCGRSHAASGRGCQDAFGVEECGDALIVAVADGHGASSCPYSAEGASIAAALFCQWFLELHQQHQDDAEAMRLYLSRNREEAIPRRIADVWMQRVKEHHRQSQHDETFSPSLYGTTLLGMVITDAFYFALQLGDGDILAVSREGAVERVTRVKRLLGTETHSLSQERAWQHVVTELRYASADAACPALFVLSTDGLSNSFASDSDFCQCGADYLAILRESGIEHVRQNLEGWLHETSRDGSGDDIAIVLAFDQRQFAEAGQPPPLEPDVPTSRAPDGSGADLAADVSAPSQAMDNDEQP